MTGPWFSQVHNALVIAGWLFDTFGRAVLLAAGVFWAIDFARRQFERMAEGVLAAAGVAAVLIAFVRDRSGRRRARTIVEQEREIAQVRAEERALADDTYDELQRVRAERDELRAIADHYHGLLLDLAVA